MSLYSWKIEKKKKEKKKKKETVGNKSKKTKKKKSSYSTGEFLAEEHRPVEGHVQDLTKAVRGLELLELGLVVLRTLRVKDLGGNKGKVVGIVGPGGWVYKILADHQSPGIGVVLPSLGPEGGGAGRSWWGGLWSRGSGT